MRADWEEETAYVALPLGAAAYALLNTSATCMLCATCYADTWQPMSL